MAQACKLYVGIVGALALFKYSLAEWNATEELANRTVSCHHHGNRNNCTDSKDTGQWSGHFSKCPRELKHYCIHGACRYVKEQNAPSCWCERGFFGSRCEYVDFGWLVGEKRQIVIACVIAGLITLILLIVFVCVCVHRRRGPCRRPGRRRRRRTDEVNDHTEKLSMMESSRPHRSSISDSAEPSQTHFV